MKRIGVLFGMEESFPPALVDYINRMGVGDIQAEFVTIGGVRMDEPNRYAVIVDRISHDIRFIARTQERDSRAPRSSTTRSGGAPTTSSSTTRWPSGWAWPFRRP
jgi:hypothetical protein